MPKILIEANQRKMISVMGFAIVEGAFSSLTKDEFDLIREKFQDKFEFLRDINEKYSSLQLDIKDMLSLKKELSGNERTKELSNKIECKIGFLSKALKNEIEGDKTRATFLITDTSLSLSALRDKVFGPALSESVTEYHYTQSDFHGSLYQALPQKSTKYHDMVVEYTRPVYHPFLNFGYIDDNSVACAISIHCVGIGPRYSFIVLTKNCNDPKLEDREQIVIYDDGYFNELGISEPDLDSPAVLENGSFVPEANKYSSRVLNTSQEDKSPLLDRLNSKKLNELVKQLFDTDGNIIIDKLSLFEKIVDKGYYNFYIELCSKYEITPLQLSLENFKPSAYKKLIIGLINQISDPNKRDQAFAEYKRSFSSDSDLKYIKKISDIIEKAKVEIHNKIVTLNFDPQGRILVEVDNNIVSFDVSKDEELLKKYYNQVRSSLSVNKIENTEAIISALQKLKSKSSIICLQQEMYMQISLALEVYKKQFSEISQDFVISPEIEQQINKEVMQKFAGALKYSYKDNEISLEKLNSKLDDDRTEIAKKSHDILVKTLVSKFPSIDLTKFNLKRAHKDAAITPATTKNILHIDNYLNTATEIEGSKYTSHYRKKGNEFAHRAIKTFRINDELEVQYQLEGTQIRTPSLPVKKGLTEQEYINDTKDKIKKLDKQYGFSKPYTYNLLTAMQDRLDDLKGTNKQTQSARHIILGVHASNREKINNSKSNLCLVQAISINGFGMPLGYRRFGFSVNLPNEATLLAEMSIIYNIEGSNILDSYKNFLQHDAPKGFLSKIFNYFRSPYFVASQEGKKLRESIVRRKQSWQNELAVDKDDIKDLVKKSLQKIMAFDLHFSHDYAKLIQSFSIFIEDNSIVSCKSSNERTIIIMLREIMLKQKYIPENLQQALMQVAAASTKKDAVTALNKLKIEINKNYNESNLYGAHAMISLVDQGAGHKIAENKNGSWNRNKAEDKGITNLKQKHTRALQAHNELADYMNAAVNNNKIRQPLHIDNEHQSSYASSLINLGVTGVTYKKLPVENKDDKDSIQVNSSENLDQNARKDECSELYNASNPRPHEEAESFTNK